MLYCLYMIHPSWNTFFAEEKTKPYFRALKRFLDQEYQNHTIFPPRHQIFSALELDKNHLKVVILGQDPYHTPGIAHGLAFSVTPGQKIPPSIQNIFKEIESDLGQPIDKNPHLIRWRDQGVLLLNNVLTVRAHEAGSHYNQGWEILTENLIKYLDSTQDNLVFLLWGKHAQSKIPLVNTNKHFILKAAHPSPFSAHRGFFGCKHFSQTNQYLKQHQKPEIKW